MCSSDLNKKRNVGLIYEFLARYMAEAIIENRDADIAKAKLVVQRHFKKGTDLHNELKLFRALHESTLPNRESVKALFDKVKSAVKLQSQQRLDLEKTSLIHEINASLGNESFFDQPIQEYKTFASIQVLLNHWRSGENDVLSLHESISEVVQLEERLIQHLLSDKTKAAEESLAVMSNARLDEGSSELLVSMLAEKINKKFGSSLNEQQRKIIQCHALSDKASLSSELSSLKIKACNLIDEAVEIEHLDEEIKNKLLETKTMITTTYSNTDDVTDDTVTFYMGISKLVKEME